MTTFHFIFSSQWRNMDRRLKLENLNCLILEFFFSKIYFLDQIYWQALVRPFKWHIGKVCIISRKKVTESGKNIKKGLKFVLFHLFWQWKWWKYIFWTKSIKSTQKMGSYGVKSFSVSFETKKLQAKQNFPWPFVHKLGIWATVTMK